MIGVLAGMGPYSSAPFLNQILSECERQYGATHDIDFPEILLHSLPTPFYPDRPVDHDAMFKALKQGLLKLERTSVDLLAIACNTAHVYFSELKQEVNKPLLNMVELAVGALPRNIGRVAVVASHVTIESQVYQSALIRNGFAPIHPGWQADIDDLISYLRRHKNNPLIQEKCAALVRKAQEKGAEGILLACLDLSSLSDYFQSNIMVIDASQILAKNIVSAWLDKTSRNRVAGKS
jgi:aspartate racemase